MYKNEHDRNFMSWLTSKFEVVQETQSCVIIICNDVTIDIQL